MLRRRLPRGAKCGLESGAPARRAKRRACAPASASTPLKALLRQSFRGPTPRGQREARRGGTCRSPSSESLVFGRSSSRNLARSQLVLTPPTRRPPAIRAIAPSKALHSVSRAPSPAPATVRRSNARVRRGGVSFVASNEGSPPTPPRGMAARRVALHRHRRHTANDAVGPTHRKREQRSGATAPLARNRRSKARVGGAGVRPSAVPTRRSMMGGAS